MTEFSFLGELAFYIEPFYCIKGSIQSKIVILRSLQRKFFLGTQKGSLAVKTRLEALSLIVYIGTIYQSTLVVYLVAKPSMSDCT